MKGIILLALTLLVATSLCQAQENSIRYRTNFHVTTNVERYKIDYELVNEDLLATDSLVLNTIALNDLEQQRQELNDVILLDETTGISILLYSEQRTMTNKKKRVGPISPSSTND